MKLLFKSIFVLCVALVLSNCNEPEPDPIVDTPPPATVKPKNQFNVNGIALWDIVYDSTSMYGLYKTNTMLTTVFVSGQTSAGKSANFELIFPGKAVGTYKFSTSPEVNIECVTGTGVAEKKYVLATTAGADMTITVTEYGAVGGKIKGTFTGNLQAAGDLSTANIKNGVFEVKRDPDQ